MIHRDRGGNCVERRLLALMISVALLGAVLPGLIGRRGAAGCTKSDGYIASDGDTASAVSSVSGERDADSTAVPTKACAALPMTAFRFSAVRYARCGSRARMPSTIRLATAAALPSCALK